MKDYSSRKAEYEHILKVLKKFKWSRTKSAVALKISRKGISNKIKEMKLTGYEILNNPCSKNYKCLVDNDRRIKDMDAQANRYSDDC